MLKLHRKDLLILAAAALMLVLCTSVFGQCTQPPSNLVAWWPGDGNTGDIIGNSNGVHVGTATYAAGKVGQAFSFDGTNYVEVADSPVLRPTTYTVDAWIYPTVVSGNHNVVFKGDHEYAMQIRNGKVVFASKSANGTYAEFQGSLDVPVNAWSHIAITQDATIKRIYVNGDLDPVTQQQDGHYTSNLGPLRIGTHNNIFEFFYGLIDEVDIIARPLTQAEIQAIYNAGSAGKCHTCISPPAEMIHWYRGENNASDEVFGQNGTLENGLAFGPGMVGNAMYFDGVDDAVGNPNYLSYIKDSFTMEFWANPNATRNVTPESTTGSTGIGGQRYAIMPQWGGSGGEAGAGVSVGTNGISVFEHADGYMPSTLVWDGAISGWTHIAVVYESKTPKLYVNGELVRTGLTSTRTFVYPSRGLGTIPSQPEYGPYGGALDEVKIYSRALSQNEVRGIFGTGSLGTCPLSCTQQPGQMTAWWRGDDNGLDSAGSNHAWLAGGVAFGNAVVNRGFVFDGNNDYIRVPASAGVDVGSASGLTADAWIRYDDAGGDPLRPILEWSGEPGDAGGFGSHIYLSAAAGVLFVNLVDTGGAFHVFETAPGAVTPGAFYHVAVTYDKTTGEARIYRNGEMMANSNLGIFTPMTAKNLYIGGRITDVYGGPQYRFVGTIDEVQLFSRPLSQSEIGAIYGSRRYGLCTPTELIDGCAAIPNGLTNWWRGQGTALDYRKANHASLMNGTTFVNGMLGNAFAFDGIDDYVSAPAFDMRSNWSVEGWVNPTSCSDDRHCTIFGRTNGTPDGLLIAFFGVSHPDNYEFGLNIGDGSVWQLALRSGSKYQFGSWYHVAATKSGDTYSLYVNGVLRDQKTVAGVSGVYQSREVRLGLWNYGTAAYLQGRIDEVSVYKRPLSPLEVWSLFTAGELGYTKCAGDQTMADMDGDMLSDLAVFRPSGASGAEWWWLKSTGGNGAVQFGASTDTVVTADYTGDGKTDIAFWQPSTGFWYVLRSEDLTYYAFPFGGTGDVPVPADYDGDGRADAAVFRASNTTWYISRTTGGTGIVQFGAAGDKPVVDDYDGDGKADIAVFRPNGTGGAEWWIAQSSGGVFATQFGQPTDKAVPADYTGDGRADIAFWNPATGYWFVLRSDDYSYYAFPFGAAGDLPVPADYDGDAKTDAGVYRPATSNWFISRSKDGLLIRQFGSAGDVPVPNTVVR